MISFASKKEIKLGETYDTLGKYNPEYIEGKKSSKITFFYIK